MLNLLVGAPQSGKTTLLQSSGAVVLSPWPGMGVVHLPPEAGVVPSAISALYAAGARSIALDEAESYCLADPLLAAPLARLGNQTTHLGLSLWIASKRPRLIPPALVAAARRLYLFRLGLPEDAAVFRAWVEPDELLRQARFHYYLIEDGVLLGQKSTSPPSISS